MQLEFLIILCSFDLVLESANENAKKVFISKALISVIDRHVVVIKEADKITMVQGTINEILLQKSML